MFAPGFHWIQVNAPLLVAVEYCREHVVDVGTRANEEENDEQQALEVEQRRLRQMVSEITEINILAITYHSPLAAGRLVVVKT